MIRADYKEFFIVSTILLVLAMIKLADVYKKLYGRRPLFECFFAFFIASAVSSAIDLVFFSGGRDFIPIGGYVANLGDFYYVLILVFLTMELVTNKKGKLSDIIKAMTK